MTWQDVTPYVTNLISLIGGFAISRHLQRETKDYDRETKRLQLLKTFYEVRSLTRPLVNSEFDERALNLIEQSQHWLESRPREADLFARVLSWGPALLVLIFLVPYLGRLMDWYLGFIPTSPHPSESARTLLLVGKAIDLIIVVVFVALLLRGFFLRAGVRWLVQWLMRKHPASFRWLAGFRF